MRRHMAGSEDGLGPGSVMGSVRASVPVGGQENGPQPALPLPSHSPLQHSPTCHWGTHCAQSPRQPMGGTPLLTQCQMFLVALKSQWAPCQGWRQMAPPLGTGTRSHRSSASQALGPTRNSPEKPLDGSSHCPAETGPLGGRHGTNHQEQEPSTGAPGHEDEHSHLCR